MTGDTAALGSLETALWTGHYDRMADSHSHRATCEDSLGIVKGRDALIARRIAAGTDNVVATLDMGDFVAVEASSGWSLHRWVWREDRRIVREIEISNRPYGHTPPMLHPPLGELRSGEGQFAAAPEPIVPPGFPEAALGLARILHRQWNGRNFADGCDPAIAELIKLLPDATFYFEHGVAAGASCAVLFRMMGHHPSGHRIRLIGSAIENEAGRTILIDLAALDAQLKASMISYA